MHLIERMTNNKPTLQECAMRYGTGMGLFWAFKFILFPLGLMIPLLQLLFLILTIAVPIVGYKFAKRFREQCCEGVVTFSRAFLFTTFMYMYAAILVAVVHYIYFRFIDNGFIISTYQTLWDQVKETATANLMPALEQYDEAINLIAGMTPLDLTLQMISNNIFVGILMTVPTALLVMRKKKNQ